jgi:hypothetical protein
MSLRPIQDAKTRGALTAEKKLSAGIGFVPEISGLGGFKRETRQTADLKPAF